MDLETLELRVSRSENLPVLPQAVSSVLRLADDVNASGREIEQVIERDPGIAAKILRVANSSYYGLQNVPSIGRAINVLGMNAVRSLVIGIAYQSMLSGGRTSQKFMKLEFWRHSLAVAIATRILAKLKVPAKAEEAYCAGMLHDIGLLVMDKFCPEELDLVITHAQQANIPLVEAEKKLLGFTHSQIGAMLAANWGLTDLMKEGVEFHHDPSASKDPSSIAAYVAAADILAHQTGFTNQVPALIYELDASIIELTGLPPEQFEAIRMVMCSEVMKAESAFQVRAA